MADCFLNIIHFVSHRIKNVHNEILFHVAIVTDNDLKFKKDPLLIEEDLLNTISF